MVPAVFAKIAEALPATKVPDPVRSRRVTSEVVDTIASVPVVEVLAPALKPPHPEPVTVTALGVVRFGTRWKIVPTLAVVLTA
jgi:hypothetical protein